MPNMFGYQNYTGQRRTPSPEEVGALLAQRQMQGLPAVGAGPGGSEETGETMPDNEGMEGEGASTETAGPMPGEPDPHAIGQQDAWPSSAEAALRAAILRATGTPTPSEPRGPAPLSRQQLLRVGMRPQEIDLLNATGGSNA